MKHIVQLAPVLLLGLLVAVQTRAQSSPLIVGSQGYINGTPLTSHTSAVLNTVGASTLVAFVSTNTPWNGLPVSISGLTDNAGNTWNVLTGPTTWAGSSSTLVSAIYYVNVPITSATETVTVNLSNPAPLVFHIFAVSGADITGPPISSAITNPGVGGTSAVVTTAPIAVPTDSLLLSWVKNETSATATAVDGYTLDAQSTSFLWAESQAPISAGSYSGQFQYSSAIGWQTAIVGLKSMGTGPEAASQAVTTKFNTPVNITLSGISPQGFPLIYSVITGPTAGTLSGTPPNLTYTPAIGYFGHDSFTFNVNDGTTNSNTATVSITVQGSVDVVSTTGYINSTPQTTHTSAAFNTVGASTLVAFVSSHPSWPVISGLPVSISGLSDSAGNTWSVLTGPTQFAGSQFTLVSAVYYVNAPITSATETVTVNLTNAAPLALHVFAVSGADTTGPPISSAITSPAAGGTSVNVTTAAIAVPTNSLLLSWVKNETSATATALGGYTLDAQSTSFLWAEFETAFSASTYTGQFQYNSATGWQTAIVGLKPPGSVVQPVLTTTPENPTNQTSASFSFTDTQTGVSFLCQLDGNAFSPCTSPASYSGLTVGSHTFSVKAQDTSNNQGAAASFTWTISAPPPPAPTITSTPANPTNQTSASLSFTDTQAGVSFLCQLDGSAFSACTSPASYSSLVQGSHTFSVEAQDTAGNQSAAAGFTWTISTTPPPIPTITSKPANPTNQISASFSFTDTEVGVSFLCQLDGGAFSACTSPAGYSGLSLASHAFSVKAQDTAGNQSAAATFTWTIQAVITPVIVSTRGYINGTPLTAHTSTAFNSVGASTLVAFVSTNTPWNGLPVSISGLTDNAGNTWNILTGPTTWAGSSSTLVSAIYYVNAPITSASETVTVNLSNPVPLVLHVFAVSGADITGPPISSAITNPGVGGTSAVVTTAPIAVPTDTLLLNWVKNDTSATATALGGYTLDAQSTSFLWAEYKAPISAGSYSGQFQYSSAIGWQTAIVGLKSMGTGPEAASQAVTTKFNTPVNITLSGISPQGFPLTYSVVTGPTAGMLSGSPPNLTYTPATGYLGNDSFTFKANDGTTNSNTATVSITVLGSVNVVSTTGYINSTPQTTHTSAAFNTVGSSTLVAFVSSHPSWNGLPVSISGLSDSAGNTWSVLTSPTQFAGSQFTLLSAVYYVNAPITSATETVTVNLTNAAPLALHVFAVSGADTTGPPISSAITSPAAGHTSANVTTAPIAVPTDSLLLSWAKNETSATATAQGGYTLDMQQSTSFLWAEFKTAPMAGTYTGQFHYDSAVGWQTAIVGLKPPGSVVQPVLTTTPANPTNQTSASFSFMDTQTGVSFLCQLDGNAFSPCTSPASYSGLSLGSHTFSVKAQDRSLNQSATVNFTWNIEAVIIAFNQAAAATPQSPTATVSVSFPAAQSVGDLNIVVVGWNDTTSSVQSVNDSAGNTYNLAIGPTSGTALQQSIYYSANIVGGSNTVTVTFNQAAAFPDVRILEYRGVTTLDATAGASGNSAAANSGPATTTSAYELIFGADTVFTTTVAAGSGFTSRIITGDGDIAEDKTATTAGSNSATATLSSAGPWVMQIVTFSFSPGPAPTVSGVSPNTGPTAGGTAVTINGTNFVTGATVTFGGTPATNVQVVLGTQITAITPAGSAGVATVTVTNPGGQNGSISSAFTYLAPPTVSAVSPNNGPAAGGTPVTITGTNFVAGATVTFGTNAATNVVVSATQITATTPAGTTGAVTVKVTNSSGLSGSLTNGFTYGPPTVSSISPNNGPAAGGTSVTITGTRFTTGATVTFGTFAATNVVIVSATKITATTPAGGAGAVNVTVTDPGGPSGSLTNGFIYGPPTVSVVSPNNGPVAGGTAVTITGTSFATGATLTFGGTAATNVVVASTTKITATTPAGTAGSVTVTVTNTGGLSGSLNNGFIYGPPAVSIVSPNTGSTAGGTPVTISGTNFATGSTVTFGTAAAKNVVVVSATQITATTPAGAAGTITVTVTDSGGQSGQSGGLANGFTYAVGPTVSSVFPNNGSTAGGTAVTITGTKFATGATVTFGAAAATNVTVVSATQITATTPAGTAGAVTVTVTNTGNLSGSLNSGFTYGSPAVSTVSPNTGSTAGGTPVTITGTNFFAGATVTFGSTAATNVVVVSVTKITATTPDGAAGAVTVTVTDSGAQSGSLTNGFTYAVVPTTGSVSPNSGPTAGGTAVTITGTNFATGATVAFGATAATNVTVVSSTKITATTQAATAGAVTVTVTIPGGQTGSLSNGFTYLPPVTIALGQVAAATPQSPTVTVSVSFPAAQSVGDLNIVVVGWNDTTSSVQSVNDSRGNTYNLAIGPTSGTALQQSIYYAANIVGGSNTVTVTFNQAAAFPDVRILEYRGVTTLDATAGASGNGTAVNSGPATTTSAYELIFGADMVFTTTRVAGSGFTSRIITGDGDIAEDKTATTAGSNSATATLSSAGPWVMQMVTFKYAR